VDRFDETNQFGWAESRPDDLIQRSAPIGARLEGWPLATSLVAVLDARNSALLWTRPMSGVDMVRTSETLH
jgi:hypothetical protein